MQTAGENVKRESDDNDAEKAEKPGLGGGRSGASLTGSVRTSCVCYSSPIQLAAISRQNLFAHRYLKR